MIGILPQKGRKDPDFSFSVLLNHDFKMSFFAYILSEYENIQRC